MFVTHKTEPVIILNPKEEGVQICAVI